MNNLFKKTSFVILILFLSIFLSFHISQAQTQSSDAIAIRVLPNPEHYSAATWYKLQGFSGSPQSIMVDGYEAVRDGRSVYVDAANVEGTELYTNIYLISFNQEAENATKDIFGLILNRWKFNTNYIVTDFCNTSSTISCLHNSDCPIDEYCLSAKAKMIRDTKRLSDLADIKILLEKYLGKRGYYPILKSGSFLSHITISTWPSWQKLFAQHLGQELPEDPINVLGDCGDPRFDKKTCWDFSTQEFADGDTSNDKFDLPADSYTYVYTTNADGSSYDLYANLEKGYGAAVTGSFSSGGTGGTTTNDAPGFISRTLSGKSGEAFSGFIGIKDDSDFSGVTVTLDTSGSTWTGWSAPPAIELVPSVPSQRKVYATAAGSPGNYFFKATVKDEKGLTSTQTFMIVIVDDPPQINVFDVSYTASTTKSIDINFQVQDAVSNYPLIYTITPDGLYGLNPATFALNGAGTLYDLNITGVFSTGSPIDPSLSYNYIVTATDKFGAMSTDNFTITVLNNKPTINVPLPCDTHVRVNNAYNPCTISASDIDGNAISHFTFGPFPAGISGNPSSGTIYSPSIVSAPQGVYAITIQAVDEYGAVSPVANYALSVDTYCGDGVKQGPGKISPQNTEARGGPTNNGREDCDGGDGLATSPSDSNLNQQYACSTPSPTSCPFIGSCVGSCSFVSGKNGGYCGDAITQDGNSGSTDFGEECDDGNINDNDLCNTTGANGYGKCTFTFCGDGVTQTPNGKGDSGTTNIGDEECDDYSNGVKTDKCYDDCTFTYCGDGIQQTFNGRGTLGLTNNGDEECDLGAANSLTGQCAPSCTLTYCGDGTVQTQNGKGDGGTSSSGDEECETDSDCATAAFYCDHCVCKCRPCEFDSSDFDFCCMF